MKISYTSFDYKACDTVPVIASFDAEGHIKPLYVRIQDTPYKIDSYWIKSQYANSTEFFCKVINRDKLTPLSLTYHAEEGVWTMPVIE
ncbi:MAG: hypothetical protein Q4D32_06225 [Eubacteriales bacterium]|nr:hypothetical protein [Eubacteriales bacterium]